MDLNYLYYRQQIETSMAEAARSAAARKVHAELANEYEKQIGEAAARKPDVRPRANPTMAVAMTAREVKDVESSAARTSSGCRGNPSCGHALRATNVRNGSKAHLSG